MNCAACGKSLSKKRARLINGRIVCSACMWKPASGTEAQRAETATEIGGSVRDGPVPEGQTPNPQIPNPK